MRAGYNGFSIGSFHKIQSKKEAEREAAKNWKQINNKQTHASKRAGQTQWGRKKYNYNKYLHKASQLECRNHNNHHQMPHPSISHHLQIRLQLKWYHRPH
jgi:hypothetical protein